MTDRRQTRKDLMRQIEEKVRRKKQLRQEMATRSTNVEEFVLKMMQEVDAMLAVVDTTMMESLSDFYINSIRQRLRVLDSDVRVEASWHYVEGSEKPPQLNGLLIKWSPTYQKIQNCEPELFVDIVNLLFR